MIKLKCPYCGKEYLPSEIYYPKDFFGNPGEVVRDLDTNEIINITGDDMNLKESYICDNCGKSFKVVASVDFKVEKDSLNDFDEEYSVQVFKSDRLTLSEE